MPLTIAETVVLNRERKRRFLRSRRERKSMRQVVSEEGQIRLARNLAADLLPHLGEMLSAAVCQSFRSAITARTDGPPGESGPNEAALSGDFRTIGSYLETVARELRSLRASLEEVRSAAVTPQPSETVAARAYLPSSTVS